MHFRTCSRVTVALGLSLLFTNCATTSRLAPISPLIQDVPVPLQQEQVAAAARAAVIQAVGSFDYIDLAGKQARVEVSGSYPPSDHDLLDFVAAVAEGQLAEHGVRIDPRSVPHAVLLQNGPTVSQPDFVASLTLDAAGVDLSTVPQLSGPIILMGVGGGSLLLGGSTVGLGALAGSSGIAIVGGVLGLIGIPLLIIGAVWAALAPHQFVADARVKLLASVHPVSNIVRAQSRPGEGTKTVRYETNKAGGFKPRMPPGW